MIAKNCCVLLLFCFLTEHARGRRARVPEPPRDPIGPFDTKNKDKNISPPPERKTDYGKLFEGDIGDSGRRPGGLVGEAGTRTPWPNAIIPYVIDCSIANMASAVKATRDAMAEWESRTCIRFVEKKPHHKVYLELFRASGCWATYVGYKGKKTQISIGFGCDYKHVMIHELGHVIGFWHEQSRPDRDQYISIKKSNVIPQLLYNFNIVSEQVNNYGEPYDYGSIMHYPWNAFAINRRYSTIEPLKPLGGKRPYERLSESDVLQTKRMYRCEAIKAGRAKQSFSIGEAKKKIGSATGLAGPKCRDSHKLCPVWAEHGHCTFAPDPMLLFCAKSCDNCGKCVDDYPDCKAWADYGFCIKHAKFMLKSCKVSCRACVPEPTTQPPTRKPTTIRTTQKPTTKKTTTTRRPTKAPRRITTTRPTAQPTPNPSGRVRPPTAKYTGKLCVDRSTYCQSWARTGRCKTDRWVYRNCMKSCKRFDICDQRMIRPDGQCAAPLGLHSDRIVTDPQLYATSVFYPGGGWSAPARAARLYREDDHSRRHVGAWCADPRSRRDTYLQIDFRAKKRITALATQGRDRYFEHVKSYSLAFSDNRRRWREYRENGVKKVFDGNCDHFTPVLNILRRPQYAQYMRIIPIKFSGAKCLRVEVYGC